MNNQMRTLMAVTAFALFTGCTSYVAMPETTPAFASNPKTGDFWMKDKYGTVYWGNVNVGPLALPPSAMHFDAFTRCAQQIISGRPERSTTLVL
jgi:hypothetical protein